MAVNYAKDRRPNCCVLHYRDNAARLADGDLLLVDAGCEYQFYASDVTRTWPVNGRFTAEQRAVYEVVLEAQLAAIDQVRAGHHWNEPHEAAVRCVTKGLLRMGLLKGRLLEEQVPPKIAEAAAAYGVAEKATGAPLVVVQQARLGQARCLVAQKKAAEAEAIFRKLTGEDASSLVLAGAWNGLADLWMVDAMTKNDQEKSDKLNDAATAYMRGVVQYGPGPGESVREYKRSLEGSMRAFKALSDVEKNADRKKAYLQRYLERKEAFEREFPGGK